MMADLRPSIACRLRLRSAFGLLDSFAVRTVRLCDGGGVVAAPVAWLAERRRTVRKPMSVQMMVARSRDASQPARRAVPQQAQETWLENKMPVSN